MSHVAIVGAGLAGLTAATLLARSGCRVILYERSALGGRARSRVQEGFTFNLGPHALYRAGAARRVLDQLGVPIRGASPPTRALGLIGDRIEPLPFDPVSAVTTPMLSGMERLEMARWFSGVALGSPERLRGTSVEGWLAECSPAVAGAARAVVRVSTYAADLERLDAGAAMAQLQRALRGVDYLDGGWQSLVSGLEAAALEAGVELRVGEPVRKVEELEAQAVLLCVAPSVAAELTGSAELARIAAEAAPVRAACLDLGLEGVVGPERRLALGVERPIYIATHSDVASLAPEGTTLIHAAIYGAEGEPAELRAELDRALDRWIPGWRARVRVERWMPRLVVAQDLPRAEVGGRRAPLAVADRPSVWVAGDWVESEGMLADAAVGSAEAAARAILATGAGRAAA